MKSVRRALYMAVVSMMLVSLSYGEGDPVVDKDSGDGDVVEFIQVTHADAQMIVSVIGELSLPVSVVATPDRKIIVRGEKADVARAIQVVAKLDTPGASAAAGVRAEFIPLGNIVTSTLMPAVGSLITGSQSNYALDSVNHMLVVHARDNEIAAVKDLLARLDQPTGSVTINLFFLRAMIGSAGADQSRELPSALVPIAKTLAANGFTEISLMAPIRLNCRMAVEPSSRSRRGIGQQFSISSRLRTNPTDGGELGDVLDFSVTGGVGLTSVQDSVELTLDARVTGQVVNAVLDKVGDVNFRVEVTIAAKFGQYVILSAAPGTTATGQAVAVVVRVTRDSSP